MRELKLNSLTWISLVRPTEDDIRGLAERFPQIHPLVLEDLRKPTIRPRVENYDHHLYMVLHFPKFTPGAEKSTSYEVDFIMMADTLITAQYDDIETLENLWHECERQETANSRYGRTTIHLLYFILQRFFFVSLRELDQIQEQIDEMEEKVFTGHEKEILEDITYLKRDILDFRRAFKPQRLTLDSLVIQSTQLYGEKVRPFVLDLIGEYLKVWDLLETHKETLDALYDTNRQLLAAKTNESMRVFTILAFITFIPTAVANIYGMNIESLPFATGENAFGFIIGLMTLSTIMVYTILKWRKLL